MASVTLTLKSNAITISDIETLANRADLKFNVISSTQIEVFSLNATKVTKWQAQFSTNPNVTRSLKEIKMIPRFIKPQAAASLAISPRATNRPWFTMSEIAAIYKTPAPTGANVVVGVVSFGGGLYGSVDQNGVLTNGDLQNYWSVLGITNYPKVIVVPINGATNNPNANDGGLTLENTLDIATVGGMCPSSNLTIILYIAPNALGQMYNIFQYAINTNVTVNGTNYKPSIISCSWGAPEIYFSSSLLNSISGLLQSATNNGINICTATGDFGSNNNVGGTGSYTDFPSSCPYVTAVGGTTLSCPNNVYDTFTTETAWSSGGGAISAHFPKPSYQAAITASGRSIADISSNADPNTGVLYILNGQYEIVGGTSVAAPTVAGFLAAINASSFFTPKLYTAPSNCFNDVSSGSNGAFSAKAGYDICTGWGSMNGANLASLFANVVASGISVLPTTLTLSINASSQIVATVTPANATNKSVTWLSSNTGVATVSNTGNVTAIAAGTAVITARTADGSNLTATTTVTVSDAPVALTSISLNVSSVSFHATNTYQLIATINPGNATDQILSWSSNNTAVATVNSSGLVTAVALGTATIKATTSNNKTAACTFTVTVPVSSVTLSPNTMALIPNQVKTLRATVLPSNAGNKSVTWSSANTAVATVNSIGSVQGKANGTTTITATTVNMSLTATATVTVTTPVQNVKLNISTVALSTGQTYQMIATVNPVTASNKTVTWTSLYPSVASVSSSGLVTCLKNGSTIITVITQDGNKRAAATINVSTPVSSVSIPATLTLAKKATSMLMPTISPITASNTAVTWSTNNGSVATVSSKGLVTAIKAGTATITARTSDGGYTSTCVLTVI